MESRKEFTVGRAFSRGVHTWIRHFAAFVLLALIVYAPLWIWGGLVAQGEITTTWLQRTELFTAASIPLSLTLNAILAGVVAPAVVQHLEGRPIAFTECIRAGFTRIGAVLGATLLFAVWTAVAGFFLFIPGVIVYCVYIIASPVAAIESTSVAGALTRSLVLTRGRRWRVFGLLLLVGGGGRFVTAVIVTLLKPEPGVPIGDLASVANQLRVAHYVELAAMPLVASLYAVSIAVMYVQLRANKDGLQVSEYTRTFE